MAKQRHEREVLCAVQRTRSRVPQLCATSIKTIPELEGMSIKKGLAGAEALAAHLIIPASHDLLDSNDAQRICAFLEGRTKAESKSNPRSGVSNVGDHQLQACLR